MRRQKLADAALALGLIVAAVTAAAAVMPARGGASAVGGASVALPHSSLAAAGDHHHPHQHNDLERLRAWNEWKTDVVLSAAMVPPGARALLPPIAQTWLRNLALGAVFYLLPGAAWLAAGAAAGRVRLLGKGGALSAGGAVRSQVATALRALPLVALLSTATEAAAEAGWTRAYMGGGGGSSSGSILSMFSSSSITSSSSTESLPAVAAAAARYVSCVLVFLLGAEAGVYYVHRAMHLSPWLYRRVHRCHHAVRGEAQLTPLAGMSFHWADGVACAAPYSLLLLLVPMHYPTFEAIVALSAWWTSSSHDNHSLGVPGVLSARHHTVHHVLGRGNYGNVTTLMDRLHGTLREPEEALSSSSSSSSSSAKRAVKAA